MRLLTKKEMKKSNKENRTIEYYIKKSEELTTYIPKEEKKDE